MAGFDKYVKSLLHFNKKNLPKLINDEVKSNIWKIKGQPRISKENAKFNSSYQFDSERINFFELNKKISLGIGKDFTLDFWICNRDTNSSGKIIEFTESKSFFRLTLYIEENKLKIKGIGEESIQSEAEIDLEINQITHIGILYYSEISRLYIYKNGYRQNTLVFKIPDGEYRIQFGNEIYLSNLDLSISEIRLSNFRRFKSDFNSKLYKEFISDDNDIFFLKFKESVIEEESSSEGFSIISGYHEIVDYNSPFNKGSSLYLSGESQLESNTNFQLGEKDFCIDGWIYIERDLTDKLSSIIEFGDLKLVYSNLESILKLQIQENSYLLSGIWNNTLFHFAIVFRLSDNSSINLYLNGQKLLRVEDIELFSTIQMNKIIYGNRLKCYLSELRVSYGIARFIGNFKIPRLPYSEDTFIKSTKVLLHCNQTSLKDERGNEWELIDESVSTSKEGAKLSRAVELFKNKQYLHLPKLTIEQTNFTIEFWTTSKFYDYNYKYLNYFEDSQGTLFCLVNKDKTQLIKLSVIKDNFYRIKIYIDSIEYIWEFKSDFNNLYHIAIEYLKDNKGIKIYLNGDSIEYRDNKYELELGKPIVGEDFEIYLGNDLSGNDFYQGTFNDFRISNILRYKEEFIPEKEELLPDNNTLSLLHLENSAQQDLMNNEWELIEGDFKKVLLRDSSYLLGKRIKVYKYQYLKMKNRIYLGGQDFTIDFFLKIEESTNSNGSILELLNLSSGFIIGIRRYKDNQGISIRIGHTDGGYRDITIEGDIFFKELSHLALIYINAKKEIKVYINGKEKECINYLIERQIFDYITLGKSYNSKWRNFEGELEEIRITDGVAIWDKEFRPITKESRSISNTDKNTSILFHFEESSTKDETGRQWKERGIFTGVKLSSIRYRFPYKSAYFDGKSSLRLMNKLELGNSDFLIDFYFLLEKFSVGSITKIFQIYNNQFTVENAIHCYIDNKTKKVYISIDYSDRLESKREIGIDQLYRISILYKKDLKIVVLYIDEEEEDFVYYSMRPTTYANLVIGHSGSDNTYYHWYESYFTGYIDKFQITEGIDNYLIRDDNFYIRENRAFKEDEYTKTLFQFKDIKLEDSRRDIFWELKGDSIFLRLEEDFSDIFVTNRWELIGNPAIKESPKFLEEETSKAFYNNGEGMNYIRSNDVDLEKIFNNEFTVDFWVYLETLEHNQGFISSNMSEYYWEGFVILCANKNLRFAVKYNDTWKDLDFFRLEEREWIHITLVRRGNILYGYKDGILKNFYEIGDFQGITNQINIGYWYRTNTGYGGLLEGYLRDIRIFGEAIDTEGIISSRDNKFYLIEEDSTKNKNSMSLKKYQYLERNIPVVLEKDFTIEAYISLEGEQVFCLIAGYREYLEIKGKNSELIVITISDIDYEISVEDITDKIHHIAITYSREKEQIRIHIDNNLTRVIDFIKITEEEFKVFIGRGRFESNGIKSISEFRISDIIRSKYLINQLEELPLVNEKDLIFLDFKEEVLKDRIEGNQWKIEGETRILPEIVEGEEYFSYSRFGNSLYLPRGTYLQLTDNKGILLGGEDFSIESWVYLRGRSVLISLRSTKGDKFIIRLNREFLEIVINEIELKKGIELKDLFQIAIEYLNQEEELVVYINGEEKVRFRNVSISEIEFNEVLIGFDKEFGDSHMYLDEFRISKGIARWRGNFLPEIQPYSLLTYPKKLVIRDKETGLQEYISLYYDLPDKGYVMYDSGVEVYAYIEKEEIKEGFSSNLRSRIGNEEYKLLRESIKLIKYLEYFYRFNKEKNYLEYSTDGIQDYRPLNLEMRELLEDKDINIRIKRVGYEEDLTDCNIIYKSVLKEDSKYIYYRFTFEEDRYSEEYLRYRKTGNEVEIILENEEIKYRIIGEGEEEINYYGEIRARNIENEEITEIKYRELGGKEDSDVISDVILEFKGIKGELYYRISEGEFTNDISQLEYKIGDSGRVEFYIENYYSKRIQARDIETEELTEKEGIELREGGEKVYIDYRVIGEQGIEFYIEGGELRYIFTDDNFTKEEKEKIIQMYLIIRDYKEQG